MRNGDYVLHSVSLLCCVLIHILDNLWTKGTKLNSLKISKSNKIWKFFYNRNCKKYGNLKKRFLQIKFKLVKLKIYLEILYTHAIQWKINLPQSSIQILQEFMVQ